MADAAPLPAPGLRNWSLLLFTSLIWGSAFLGMSVALTGYGPITVAAGRVAIGAVALLLFVALSGQWRGVRPTPRMAAQVALIGVVNVAIPFLCLAWALQHVPSAFAGVTMGSVPLLLMPLVFVFSKEEQIGPARVIGMLLGFAGLVLLVGNGAGETRGDPLEITGRVVCFGAVIGYAIGSILTRRAPPLPQSILTCGFLVAASLVLVPLALVIEGLPPAAPPPAATMALVYTGLMPTALAFFLRTIVIRSAGSLFMSLVAYLVPVWAVIFGMTLGREHLPPTLFASLALILGGIALSEAGKLRRRA